MILVAQFGIPLVPPGFGVEMQAKNDVRTQLRINQPGPLPDLAGAVKENFALPAHSLLSERIVRSLKFFGADFLFRWLSEFRGPFRENHRGERE